jgi:hypothetical protein
MISRTALAAVLSSDEESVGKVAVLYMLAKGQCSGFSAMRPLTNLCNRLEIKV